MIGVPFFRLNLCKGGQKLNIQQMRIVQAIADHGSFREAAKRLYLSQPSLSQAVKELETELEVQLFERTNQGARLTAEGSEFLDHASRS